MPYIVTAGTLMPAAAGHEQQIDPMTATRTAVATLDEAREAALTHTEPYDIARLHRAAIDLPEQGGTVGPLPDGTMIEVRPVSWIDFGAMVRERYGYQGGGHLDIAAFNARQS